MIFSGHELKTLTVCRDERVFPIARVDDDDDDSVGGKLAVVDVVFEVEVTDRGQGETERGRISIERLNGTPSMFYKGHLSRDGQYWQMTFLTNT